MPELNFAARGADHFYVDIADVNERALVKQFDQCLENLEFSRRELGKVARQLKEQYVSKGKRVAGMGWESFLQARALNVDVVDKWILRYEQHEGIKPPRPSQAKFSSRPLSRTNYPQTKDLGKSSTPDQDMYVPDGYRQLGKDEKGNYTYAKTEWSKASASTTGTETPAEVEAKVETVNEARSVSEPQPEAEPCVEFIAIQIADLAGNRLSQLSNMGDRTAAMRSAVETLQQQGTLPKVATVN